MSAALALSPSHFENHLGKRSRSGDDEDYYAQAGKRTRPYSISRRAQGLQALHSLYPSMSEKVRCPRGSLDFSGSLFDVVFTQFWAVSSLPQDLLHILELCDDDVEAAIRRLDSLNLGAERRPDGQPQGEQQGECHDGLRSHAAAFTLFALAGEVAFSVAVGRSWLWDAKLTPPPSNHQDPLLSRVE